MYYYNKIIIIIIIIINIVVIIIYFVTDKTALHAARIVLSRSSLDICLS